MKLVFAALYLFVLGFTTATGTCSSSGSLSWPPVGDCTRPLNYPTIVQSCRACCMNDANCFQACVKAGGLRKRDTIDEQFFGIIGEKRELASRAVELSCTTNEECYKFTDGSLLCLNLGTGDYHDDVGGNGNYYSGVYTAPDGKVQTGTSTGTARVSDKTSSVAPRTSGTAASGLATSTGAAGITSTATSPKSSAAASVTSTAGGDVLRRGVSVGLLGLVAGFVL